MTNRTVHPSPRSPSKAVSAFQWPIPPPNTHLRYMNNQSKDITIKEILDRYQDDPELLKYILTAKAEEDKKKAAKDTLKVEEARIQLRQMDIELAREHSKLSTHYDTSRHSHSAHPPPSPQTLPPPQPSYYGLAPVQQQLLARFNYPYREQPPPSPAMSYPHSAHPLCQPTPVTEESLVFPVEESTNRMKRNRLSVSSEVEDKLSHNKVMEALKAKIKRGNNGPLSPLTPVRPPHNTHKRRKDGTSRLAGRVEAERVLTSPSPSPRSAKPVLPLIDTSVGRIDNSLLSINKHNESAESDKNSGSSADSSDTNSNDSNNKIREDIEDVNTVL
ncbi:hypothetical protein BDB01DRAFT_790793 [Pilobolus umbonatus]|nr:hypothetical protein BDB01DRAFT_790793 [Pilobolus umbonatus]